VRLRLISCWRREIPGHEKLKPDLHRVDNSAGPGGGKGPAEEQPERRPGGQVRRPGGSMLARLFLLVLRSWHDAANLGVWGRAPVTYSPGLGTIRSIEVRCRQTVRFFEPVS